MKRPVSILCISDLHVANDDPAPFDRLKNDFEEYVGKGPENARWCPDYVVIAGDIVNHAHSKYEHAKKSISDMCRVFSIPKERVIIVPGNHDKECKEVTKEDEEKDRKVFMEICGAREHPEKRDKELESSFVDRFYERFKYYIAFCDEYFKGKESSAPAWLEKGLACLSGIKVFSDNQLCFLMVNTEWLYSINNPMKERLCAPLIKEMYLSIRRDYPDYLVVTVMHRGFEYMNWHEKNVTDKAAVNSVRMLINMSDVIITGHDHVVDTPPPSFIHNQVQHFRIGSAGLPELFTKEVSRTAAIIRLSPASNLIEKMNLMYEDRGGGTKGWRFIRDERTYPLLSKYDRNLRLPPHVFEGKTVIQARSSESKDVKTAIEAYYGGMDGMSFYVIKVDRF